MSKLRIAASEGSRMVTLYLRTCHERIVVASNKYTFDRPYGCAPLCLYVVPAPRARVRDALIHRAAEKEGVLENLDFRHTGFSETNFRQCRFSETQRIRRAGDFT